jgi:hypothetical protein
MGVQITQILPTFQGSNDKQSHLLAKFFPGFLCPYFYWFMILAFENQHDTLSAIECRHLS